jgi:hypothetical protein
VKYHKHIPCLVIVTLPPIVLQVVVLLSSVLMNEAEVYASRILLMMLLAPVSASALSGYVDNEACYSLSTQWLGQMILLA